MKAHVVVFSMLAAGCAATPQLEDQQAVATNLSQYRAVYASIDAPPEVREKDGYLATSGRLLAQFVGNLGALGKSAAIGAAPTREKALEARLTVTDFNYVGTAARVMVGLLAGQAKLAVTLTLQDSTSGSVVGVVSASDSSSLLQGAFSPDTDRQVEAIAKELAARLEAVAPGGGPARAAANPAAGAPPGDTVVSVKLEDLPRWPTRFAELRAIVPASNVGNERPGPALSAADVFEKTAASVWAVRALDAQGSLLASGSGIIVAPQRAVTTCHLFVKASSVELRRGAEVHAGKLEHADAERNLCVIAADSLRAAPVPLSPATSLRVGQRAYAITFAEKLGVSLDEGMLSGLQAGDPTLPPLRLTAPLPAGANGAGIFDERARLIGIVTLNAPRADLPPNVSFALPAEWIAEVPQRARQQLTRLQTERAEPKTLAAPSEQRTGLPAVGSRWIYSMREEVFGGAAREFSVQLVRADGWNVTEILASGGQRETYAADAADVAFQERRLSSESTVELAPYLLAHLPTPSLPLKEAPRAYPGPGYAQDWKLRVTELRREEVAVPAGRFDAFRLQVVGENEKMLFGTSEFSSLRGDYRTQRFEYTVWYAPQIGRYVQAHHKTFNRTGTAVGDEWIKLKKFELEPAAPTSEKR